MVTTKARSHIDPEMTDERAREFDANMDLLMQFTSAILDDLSLGESMPLGATVFVLPDEDPALAATNLARAHHASQEGHDVIIWTTGGQMTHLQSLRPKWPAQAAYIALSVDYYAAEDLLKVRFDGLYDEQRPLENLEHNRFASISVHQETKEVVGYELPRFLADTVNVAPALANWLSVAKLHGTTSAAIEQMPDAESLRGRQLATFADFRRCLEVAAAST